MLICSLSSMHVASKIAKSVGAIMICNNFMPFLNAHFDFLALPSIVN